MDATLAELKIEALVHDPPGKAPTLWYRRHADFSARLVEAILGRPPMHDAVVREADQCAAGVDRSGLPRQPDDFRADFLVRPEIVHPFSGTKYELRPLRELDPGLIEDEQRRVVEEVVRLAGGPGRDPERLYWYLWRGLEDALSAKPGIGQLWRHLPADTRIPDHSIWDHVRLASSFAGALPEPALLLFSFGPVQGLIAAARRTGDLWAGSFLLSWLCWRAMRDLVAEVGADAVVFPDLKRQPLVDAWLRERGWSDIPGLSEPSRVASLPNRFLALVPAGRGKALAQGCEAALHAAAEEFTRGCVEELLRDLPGSHRTLASSRAAAQIASSLACQWHVLPWLEPEAALQAESTDVLGQSVAHIWSSLDELARVREYRPNRGSYFPVHTALVEAAHGAAKAVRRFTQTDDGNPRCTVCGVRGGLWDDDGRNRRGIRDGERLCGLCAARRRAPRSTWGREAVGADVLFPSTHNLAASPFLDRVLDAAIRLNAGAAGEHDRALLDAMRDVIAAAGEGVDSQYATEALIRKARQCGRFRDVAEQLVKLPAELLDPASYEDRAALAELGLDEAAAAMARNAVLRFRALCDRAGIGAPGTYYGVLLMDGDHMGRWLSGELSPVVARALHDNARPREADACAVLERTRRPLTAAHQAALSRALNELSLEIVERVVELIHGGVVVYAGGDDVLAMLPLPAVLPCVRDLRRLYSGLPLHVSSRAGAHGFRSERGWVEGPAGLWRTMGERATCSMGVAIAHAKWPLRHTLETAREMERHAKRALDRNAVAIAVMKRSGSHERFAARWGEGDGLGVGLAGEAPSLGDPLAPIEDVAELIIAGKLGRRFAYSLREEARVLLALPGALRERAYWLLQRHWRNGKANPFDSGHAMTLAADLEVLGQFLARDPLSGPHVSDEDQPASRLMAALGLADFVARGGADRE